MFTLLVSQEQEQEQEQAQEQEQEQPIHNNLFITALILFLCHFSFSYGRALI